MAFFLRAKLDKPVVARVDNPMEQPRENKPQAFNHVSPIVLVLVAALLLVEVVLQAGERGLIGGPSALGWRLELVRNFGFHKAVFDHVLSGGNIEGKVVWPFLSYIFVHRSFAHMLIATALILGMGKLISDRFSGLAVVVLFGACGLAGALAFGLFSAPGGFPLTGAYPVFYGFIGTFTWIRISDLRQQGKNILPAFNAVGMFVVFRSAFALMYGLSNSWMADLAGLITGFLLAFLLAPNGKDRIKGWIEVARRR